jgi:dihydrofolate reductase
MRKLKLEMQVSVDGYTAAADGGVDWMLWPWSDTWPWDAELRALHDGLTASADCILLSGRMAEEGFCNHWERVAGDVRNPQSGFARAITATRKVVATRTIPTSRWRNTELLRGDLVDALTRLKQEPGRDILAYGGPTLASALIDARLVDEAYLFVNPVVLGQGRPMFKDLHGHARLKARRATCFPCGMTVLEYTAGTNP